MNKNNWEKEFEKMFYKDIISKGRKEFLPELIKIFISQTLQQQREEIAEEIKELALPYDGAKWFNDVPIKKVLDIINPPQTGESKK